MKCYVKIVTIFVLGVLFIGISSASGETLQDAIKTMIQTNPDVRAVVYNRLARDQEVIQAKAGYFPTLDTSLSGGNQQWYHPIDDSLWPRTARFLCSPGDTAIQSTCTRVSGSTSIFALTTSRYRSTASGSK